MCSFLEKRNEKGVHYSRRTSWNLAALCSFRESQANSSLQYSIQKSREKELETCREEVKELNSELVESLFQFSRTSTSFPRALQFLILCLKIVLLTGFLVLFGLVSTFLIRVCPSLTNERGIAFAHNHSEILPHASNIWSEKKMTSA